MHRGFATFPEPGASMTELVLFLLSPRLIAIDSALPLGVALKASNPSLCVKFVSFDRATYESILKNETLVAGLARTDGLELIDLALPIATKLQQTVRLFQRVILSSRPVLFNGLPYSNWFYAIVRMLARLRGGRAFLLWKTRSPDITLYHFHRLRDAPKGRLCLLARLFRHDVDGLVHFHDDQEKTMSWSSGYGRYMQAPRAKLGLSHRFPAWQQVVEQEIRAEREVLAGHGWHADSEIYVSFPAKPESGEFLREPDSVQYSFARMVDVLMRDRPEAKLLLRPHPLALGHSYIQAALSKYPGRIAISNRHPEVLYALGRRVLFVNPSNVMFTCYPGRVIDVSDYSEAHRAAFADRSLAEGYGSVLVNPRDTDFDVRLLELVARDEAFDMLADNSKAASLQARNPVTLEPLWRLAPWLSKDAGEAKNTKPNFQETRT